LLGSEHAKNRVFSHVFTPEGLLGEGNSWEYFEDFLRNKTISQAKFTAAAGALAAPFTVRGLPENAPTHRRC
jgi:hypothetical protein